MSQSKGRKSQAGLKVKANLDTLGIVHPNAAGIDIGSREIWVAVPPDRAGETVCCFGAFTPDLQALADWLVECQIDTVAMESTGVYWNRLWAAFWPPRLTITKKRARGVRWKRWLGRVLGRS